MLNLNERSRVWFGDIEVYPNFFCATFINWMDPQRMMIFYLRDTDKKDTIVATFKQMEEFMTNNVNVFYNGLDYDMVVLNYCFQNRSQVDTRTIKSFSDSLILEDKRPWKYLHKQERFVVIDPINTLFSFKQRVSLKHCGIRLGFHKLQDLPYPPDCILNQQQMIEVVKYNANDCHLLMALFNDRIEDFQARLDIAKEFNLDPLNLINKDNVKVGIEIGKKEYLEISGRKYEEFKGHTPSMPEEGICLNDVILPMVNFKTKENQEMLELMKGTWVKSTKSDFDFKTKIGKLVISYGTGGVHSINKPGKSLATPNVKLKTCDVASLYPSLEIENLFYPRHLGVSWPMAKKNMRTKRIDAKKLKLKVKDAGLKLSLNGTFGMLGSKHWLGDYFTLLQVTINGQLQLTMLAEDLHLAGFEIEELNTDGINAFVPVDREEEYYQICKDWEVKTKLILEYDDYVSIYRTSVNDYVALTASGKVKRKGDFEHAKNRPLDKGWEYPIISDAITAYFIFNKPIMETFKECQDINEFMMTKKAGKMKLFIQDDSGMITKLQKTNRYIASNNGVWLKGETEKSITSICKDTRVTILNDLPSKNPKDYDLNYEFYLSVAQNIIDKVEGLLNDKVFIREKNGEKYLNIRINKVTKRAVMFTAQDLRELTFYERYKKEDWELIPVE